MASLSIQITANNRVRRVAHFTPLVTTCVFCHAPVRSKKASAIEAAMKRSHEPDTVHWRGKMQRNEEDMPGLSTSPPANMDSVPDELLASIIRLLPWRERIASVERVSRRWRRVAVEGGWSDFTVFKNVKCIAPRARNWKTSPKVELTARLTSRSHN